jgi:hypothetical protein
MPVTSAEIDSAIPTGGTPSRSLTNALLKTLVAEQQAEFRVNVAGQYYPTVAAQWVTSGAPSADTIYFTPFVIKEEVEIDKLALRVLTGATSGEMQLAIYASSATTSLPTGSALADTGVVATTTATLIDASVTPVTLTPGIYYFAVQGNNTALRWYSIGNTSGSVVAQITGTGSAAALFTSSGGAAVNVSASQAYGSWPTNPTVTIAGATSSLAPFGGYRVTP